MAENFSSTTDTFLHSVYTIPFVILLQPIHQWSQVDVDEIAILALHFSNALVDLHREKLSFYKIPLDGKCGVNGLNNSKSERVSVIHCERNSPDHSRSAIADALGKIFESKLYSSILSDQIAASAP